MSTAEEKEAAAASLRWHAAELETAFDGISVLSAQAWRCPAADAFEQEAAEQCAALRSAAAVLRGAAASLDAAAAAQRAAAAPPVVPSLPPPGAC